MPEAWDFPNSLRWAPDTHSLSVSNIHLMKRSVEIDAESPVDYGIIPDWDGGENEEWNFFGVTLTNRFGRVDFVVYVPEDDVVEDSGLLKWSESWEEVRFGIIDICDKDHSLWDHTQTTEVKKDISWTDSEGQEVFGEVVWSVKEEFEHEKKTVEVQTPELARYFQIYEAIRERWLALGKVFEYDSEEYTTKVVRNVDETVVNPNNTNILIQQAIPIEWKTHYGENTLAAFVPRHDVLGGGSDFFFPTTNGWPLALQHRWVDVGFFLGSRSFHPSWTVLGTAVSSSPLPTNFQKAKISLKELLPNFMNNSIIFGGNLEEFFSTLDSEAKWNTQPYFWLDHATNWNVVICDGFAVASPTGFTRSWEVERYPESIPNWTIESFFKVHTNIPHYFEPVNVETTVLTGVVITNTYITISNCETITNEYYFAEARWGEGGQLAYGWQTEEFDQYFASEGNTRTNYQLKSSWFDWAPDRARLMYEFPDYGSEMTTTWHIASHDGFFLNSQTNWVPVVSTNVLIDSVGRDNQFRYTREISVNSENEVESVTVSLFSCVDGDCQNLEFVSSQTSTEPELFIFEGTFEQDFIAPGFTAQDYGIHHATTVVAAMTHTVRGFVPDTEVTYQLVTGNFGSDSISYEGFDTSNDCFPSFIDDSSSFTNSFPQDFQTNKIISVTEAPPAESGVSLTEWHRVQVTEDSNYDNTVDDGEPTPCRDSVTTITRTRKRVSTNKREASGWEFTTRKIPLESVGATVSVYFIHPRRIGQEDQSTSTFRKVFNRLEQHFDPCQSGQRPPIGAAKGLIYEYRGMDGAGGRLVSQSFVSPGSRYNNSVLSGSIDHAYNISGLVSASGSSVQSCFGSTYTKTGSDTIGWNRLSEITSIPVAVFEWDFDYK